MIRYVSVFLLCSYFVSCAFALDVGVASCDITPDVKAHVVPLAGYGARKGKPAEGVHDRLQAKILYFRDADTETALITADLRSITPEFIAQIEEKTSYLGPVSEHLLVCASHTHAGPSMYPEPFWQLQFGVYDPAIVDAMSTSVAEAVARAVKNAAPARIGFGEKTVAGFTRNRRWGYDTAARETAGETPLTRPRLWVMRVDDMDGKARALLVNFAAHPTIAGADNMLVSAEWPGVLQRELEQAFPGAVALFTNGAEGDQSPEGAKGDDAFARIEDYGSRLAAQAQILAKEISGKPNLTVSALSARPELPEISFSEGIRTGSYANMLGPALEALPRKADLRFLRVGDTVLVGLPGEPLCAVGAAVEDAIRAQGFGEVVVVGLADGYIGYIVNDQEYAHGGYEVDLRSYYGPGLGAFIARETGAAVSALH